MPNTSSPHSPKNVPRETRRLTSDERQEIRNSWRREISIAIASGRPEEPLSLDEEAQLDHDLDDLKRRFHQWVRFEEVGQPTIGMVMEQLSDLDRATKEFQNKLADLKPPTLSLLLESIDNESPLLDTSGPIYGESGPPTSGFSDPVFILNRFAMSLDDDPTVASIERNRKREGLVQNFQALQEGIALAINRIQKLGVKKKNNVFSGIYGGSLGQLCRDCHVLLKKYNVKTEQEFYLIKKFLDALYPWISDKLDDSDFERTLSNAVRYYKASYEADQKSNKNIDRILNEAFDGNEDIFDPPISDRIMEARKAKGMLLTRRFKNLTASSSESNRRRPKKVQVYPNKIAQIKTSIHQNATNRPVSLEAVTNIQAEEEEFTNSRFLSHDWSSDLE